jgi:hypothetical protein
VPGTLEARILARFRRRRGKAEKLRSGTWVLRPAQSLRDAVWPGVPAWQPASIFALALLIGLTAGTLVPSSALTSAGAVQDETAAVDTVPNLDLSGDF